MSIHVSEWVWEHSEAKGSARLVLLAIADYANREGEHAYPKVSTIAAKCRISEETVRKAIIDLTALGELEVVRNGGGAGSYYSPRHRPNLYRLPKFAEQAHGGVIPETAASDPPKRGPQDLGFTYEEPSVCQPSVNRLVLKTSGDPARALLDAWWDAQHPKPCTPYMAALGVVKRALKTRSADDVRWLLDHAPVISGGAFDMAWSQRSGKRAGPGRETAGQIAARMLGGAGR